MATANKPAVKVETLWNRAFNESQRKHLQDEDTLALTTVSVILLTLITVATVAMAATVYLAS